MSQKKARQIRKERSRKWEEAAVFTGLHSPRIVAQIDQFTAAMQEASRKAGDSTSLASPVFDHWVADSLRSMYVEEKFCKHALAIAEQAIQQQKLPELVVHLKHNVLYCMPCAIQIEKSILGTPAARTCDFCKQTGVKTKEAITYRETTTICFRLCLSCQEKLTSLSQASIETVETVEITDRKAAMEELERRSQQ